MEVTYFNMLQYICVVGMLVGAIYHIYLYKHTKNKLTLLLSYILIVYIPLILVNNQEFVMLIQFLLLVGFIYGYVIQKELKWSILILIQTYFFLNIIFGISEWIIENAHILAYAILTSSLWTINGLLFMIIVMKHYNHMKKEYKENNYWDWLENVHLYEDIEKYNKILEENPEAPHALIIRGLIHYNRKDYYQAINDFIKVNVSPKGYEYFYQTRAKTYYAIQEFHKAIKDLTKLIEVNPDVTSAYSYRANAYYKQGNYRQALIDYDMTIQLSDKAYHYDFFNRANAYYELEEYQLALKDYTTAINLSNSFDRAYPGRGNTYRKLGLLDDALNDYYSALELGYDEAIIYKKIGILHYEMENYELAYKDLQKVLEHRPEDEETKKFLQKLSVGTAHDANREVPK